MEKQTKETPIKNYDNTDRNFQATDKDRQEDKKEHGKIQPEKYPVNDNKTMEDTNK